MTPAALLLLVALVPALPPGTSGRPEPEGITEGCYACADYRCAVEASTCLLGTVPDPCNCCIQGLCARLDGEPCWNSSIPELPKTRRNEGLCARNYVCQLRDDLEPEDVPEATCVCMEPGPACGSDNRTYNTACALHEAAMRSPDLGLRLQHLGPCPSRPRIYSAPENVITAPEHLVVLGCEAKGFPLPELTWEFDAADGHRVLRLPGDDLEDGSVNSSEIPETFIRTSWLQIEHMSRQHAGTYRCIASNSVGQASAASVVSIA